MIPFIFRVLLFQHYIRETDTSEVALKANSARKRVFDLTKYLLHGYMGFGATLS